MNLKQGHEYRVILINWVAYSRSSNESSIFRLKGEMVNRLERLKQLDLRNSIRVTSELKGGQQSTILNTQELSIFMRKSEISGQAPA